MAVRPQGLRGPQAWSGAEAGHPRRRKVALTDDQARSWAEILVHTHDMLDAARAEDWARVAELETLRWTLLSVAVTPAAEDVAGARAVAACISEVLAMDGRLLEHLSSARATAGAKIVEFRAGQQARSAYAVAEAVVPTTDA